MMLKSSTFLLAATCIVLGCRNSNFERMKADAVQKANPADNGLHVVDTSATISFRKDILFITETQCGATSGCHSAQAVASGTSPIGLFDYTGVTQAQVGGLLYSSVIWDGNASRMPRKSTSQIDLRYRVALKKWIDNGMPNN